MLKRTLAADTRKGVVKALAAAEKRLAAQEAEEQRLCGLYSFQASVVKEHGGGVAIGLDEVGRGPLAGPLAVGAVVLPEEPRIPGLNDSKKLSAAQREAVAAQVKEHALAWAVCYIEPHDIDAWGMTRSLKTAFARAVDAVEAQGIRASVLLLDGNPLRFDAREVNLVKGDGRCASIAAASIVAKVERDALMCRLAQDYPAYGFDQNKGYGSAFHMQALEAHGLSPVHRKSFCSFLEQPTLF